MLGEGEEMREQRICYGCSRPILAEGLAFNMGFGPVYYCTDCKPPAKNVEEAVGEILDVMNPPQGKEPIEPEGAQ